MVEKVPSPSNTMSNPIADVLPAATVIDTMIELRFQLYELEQQIQALQPRANAYSSRENTCQIIVVPSRLKTFSFNTCLGRGVLTQ
jgi:hypothetical protein